LPPVVPATAEPPLVETAAAKPQTREDNVWHGEPLPGAPPRPLADSSLALCRWSSVGGKVTTRPRQGTSKHAEGPFVGTFACTLDESKGLVLPQKASEQMGLPRYVYVTPGPDDCLWLCSAAALERVTDKFSADVGRLYYAQTARVAVDRGGRIALPESLGPLDCFCRDVVLLGAGDHFELWDAQRLQHYMEQMATKKGMTNVE
jgi:MraZ protein